MTYLECIRIQTGDGANASSSDDLWAQVQGELDNLEPGQSQIVSRLDQPGEVMVLLRWGPQSFDPRGSAVAQALMGELRRHGLVSYSVWQAL